MTIPHRLIFAVVAASLSLAAARASCAADAPSYPPQACVEEIRERLERSSREHPRLLANRSQLAALREGLEEDPLRQQLAQVIIQEAVRLRDVEPVKREMIGRRLLHTSRLCIQRVLVLATAYHLTGDAAHADRCRQELLAAARFENWNPEHFLDVAEMTFALAIGYDWLHEQIGEDARREIRTAIIEKGVRLPLESQHNRWIRARNNWGQVCHAGMLAGALAVWEDEPELASRTVHNAVHHVTHSMAAYAPNGSYPEGPGYWVYGTNYNVLLIEMLENVFDTDFGLSAAPGFSQTGAFPALACGPSGLYFNYSDGGAGRGPDPTLFWFAARYNRPDWLWGEHQRWQAQLSLPPAAATSNRLGALAMLWMKGAHEPRESSLPLHWSSEGEAPVAIHRSSWTDPAATYVGLKAGSPSANHGQMDVGSFVLDSDGVRWAVDLGHEDYHRIESRNLNLWNSAQNSDRWKIFRQSNHGHNTLVIDDQLQVSAGNAPIVTFSDKPERPHTIVDLTPVYRGQCTTVRRGVMLLPSGEVVIQDELAGLRPESRVRWGMITPGKAEDLHQPAIVLHHGGKRLKLTLHAPAGVGWTQIDTATPRHEWDSPNPGTTMIAFEAVTPVSGELTLTVIATPGSCDAPIEQQSPVKPLSEWGQNL